MATPAPAPAHGHDEERASASEKPTTSRTSTPPPAPASSLPLRPTLHDRYTHLSRRLLPASTYTLPHTRLTLPRSRVFALLLTTLLLLLILTIAVPVGLTAAHRARARAQANLPLPSNSAVHTGDGTYYAPALGACGLTSSGSEMVAAVSWRVWDAVQVGGNPNTNPLCGRKIRVRRAGRRGAVEVTVVDRCTGCRPEDVDMSIAAFEIVAEEVEGRVGVEWAWVL
ncbi:RlpA-like double-psi beta-barrel-protein domain-containing protein-containing protein [Geopyxis carbonaria]|nr:RlpA-like double-psi beta-barrel-protein domain-containing protein-containing protein [Geopyxis carbonaria]